MRNPSSSGWPRSTSWSTRRPFAIRCRPSSGASAIWSALCRAPRRVTRPRASWWCCGVRSLKVGFNKVFGYYIEVSHANTAKLPDDYVRKQTLTGGERYITPELKEKEAIVLSAQERITARELEILRDLGAKVAESSPSL